MNKPQNHQLLASRETAPTLPEGISTADAIHVWLDLMRAAEKLVMAGITREVGPGQAKAAYRRWYSEQADRHGQHLLKLAAKLGKAGDK